MEISTEVYTLSSSCYKFINELSNWCWIQLYPEVITAASVICNFLRRLFTTHLTLSFSFPKNNFNAYNTFFPISFSSYKRSHVHKIELLIMMFSMSYLEKRKKNSWIDFVLICKTVFIFIAFYWTFSLKQNKGTPEKWYYL